MDNSYFDAMYRHSDDPWGFASRWYEQRKYHLTLAALPRRRFRNAFEAGCSIGVFTELLADRCDRLLAVDLSERAIAIAEQRLASVSDRVTVQTRDFVKDWPDGRFDLIVLSEVLYYLAPPDLEEVVRRAHKALADDGHLIAVHWRRQVDEYPANGDQVHDWLSSTDLSPAGSYRDDDFRLDVYRATPGDSVAEVEGLV